MKKIIGKITEEESLIGCADMWNYIGHKKKMKHTTFKELWPNFEEIAGDCWACHFDSFHGDYCENCPMWNGSVTKCLDSDSSYIKWEMVHPRSKEGVQAAFAIRDLALYKLEKLYKKLK